MYFRVLIPPPLSALLVPRVVRGEEEEEITTEAGKMDGARGREEMEKEKRKRDKIGIDGGDN